MHGPLVGLAGARLRLLVFTGGLDAEVMAVAFEEFGILLDTHRARTALRFLDSGMPRG
ncbi:hypothetical protein [Streptomyces sp. Mg1]|uniref:hypothetical protein n=1 Tax=Streptomyces sp. Mg1 TaxID=465541 RepID=UPI001319C982|nr:hypothetical protein [Streptomyces sp. Mg1]